MQNEGICKINPLVFCVFLAISPWKRIFYSSMNREYGIMFVFRDFWRNSEFEGKFIGYWSLS